MGTAMGQTAMPDTPDGAATPLTPQRVARYPPPGTRIPGSFRFTHDGQSLYFLLAEDRGTVRSLFREDVATGAREVAARPPTTGAPAETLPREEVLRRERQRIQERGITQYVLAARAHVAVFAYAGDLYLVRQGQEARRLTETASAEIDPQLSPDGRRLAFVRDGEVIVMDLETRQETRLTEGAREGVSHGVAEFIAQEEMDRPSGLWWSPDGARLAYTEVDETGIPIYPIVHQGTREWDVEQHHYPFAGGPNARVRLGVVRLASSRTRWLDLSPGNDDIYLARVAWEPGGETLLAEVESRDQKSLRLVRFDAATGAATPLLEENSETWIDLHDDLRPLRDGRFVWSSERSGFRHLELRRQDGALQRTLTAGDWGVDALAGVDEEKGIVYFTAWKDGPLERRLYRVGAAGGEVEAVAGEPGFHTVTISPDGRWLVDVHESAATPPRVTLKDGTGGVARVLDANDDPEVRSLGLRPPRFVTLKAGDGSLLHGAIYTPPRMARGLKYPAIVRVYGGPTVQTVQDSWEVTDDLRAQYLAQKGYVVFRLDNRGTPRRGRAFETALYHRLGSVEVEDQIAGARYLAALPYVDGSRIGIYGGSYGGYMAARCLLLAPELFRAAVAWSPVTDWDGYDTHYTERYMGRPQDNPDRYRESSLLPLASSLRGELLIIHGMADENVHFRHTARLLNVLNAAAKEYGLLIFPDERHLPRGEDDRRYLEERIAGHFDRFLKGGPARGPGRRPASKKTSGPLPGGKRPRS